MINKDIVYQLINRLAVEKNFFIVDLIFKPEKKIMVFIDNHNGISIEECVFVNRRLKAHFGIEIEDYELFISSPGLDKPFKIKEQYIKNIGKNIEIKTIDGAHQKGILSEVNVHGIVLECNEKSVKAEHLQTQSFTKKYFEFNNIQQAKAVILFK